MSKGNASSKSIVTNTGVKENIITINGGTFTSNGRTIENNSGTININGGIFESAAKDTIYNAGSGDININGGIFKTSSSGTTIWN